ADVTLHVLRLDGTRTEVSWDRGAYEYLTNAGWDSRGPLLSVQSRDQRTVLVLAADADTGRTTLLHTERDDVLSRTEEGGAAVVAWRGGTRAAIASHEAEPALKPRITWLTLGPRELRAALLLPSWYRPGTRLPVLLSPYGGPAMQRVVRVRDAAFCADQWFRTGL